VAPPVPIPNTEVKRPSADDTEGVTLCGKYATARRLNYQMAVTINCYQDVYAISCFAACFIIR
jgi:hypothetical protein